MDTFELIESFYEQTLSETALEEFEKNCETDAAFANDVATYILTRKELKNILLQQKKQEWLSKTVAKKANALFIKPFKKIADYKWRVAAAAIIILVVGTYFFETQSSSQKLAETFIKNNFTQLSLTMDGSKDSMQTGLAAYNKKDYATALIMFDGVYANHPDNNDALKDAGIAYLVMKDYDKAIMSFDILADKKLFSNPGVFYKALTLLARDKSGDKEAAKLLLQQVVSQNLEGTKDASEWLKKI